MICLICNLQGLPDERELRRHMEEAHGKYIKEEAKVQQEAFKNVLFGNSQDISILTLAEACDASIEATLNYIINFCEREMELIIERPGDSQAEWFEDYTRLKSLSKKLKKLVLSLP